MSFRCPVCGCTTNHYSSARIAYVCDRCGYTVSNSEEESKRERFDRAYRKACEHQLVGNYQECLNILLSLQNDFPAEKKLHQLILRAATHDFEDTGPLDDSRKEAARKAWDRLKRLNALERDALGYSRAACIRHRKKLEAQKKLLVRRLIAVAVLLFLCGIVYEMQEGFLLIVMLAGVYMIIRKIGYDHPVRTVRKLREFDSDYRENPFRKEEQP